MARPSNDEHGGAGGGGGARKCPQCGKPRLESYRPFCSKRCADIDLGRWLNGVYAIPAAAEDEDDEETPRGNGVSRG